MTRQLSCLILLFTLAGCETEKHYRERTIEASLPALEGWGKARPVDEATADPSLAAFRDTLIDIASRRDSAALAARLSPTIRFSFGDSRGGPPAFFAQWAKNQSMRNLWATLTDGLEHGGRMRDSVSFVAPWTFNALPDSLDAFEYLIVRDSNVVVHATPGADSVLGALSFDIVRAKGAPTDSLWRSVQLKDGRTGYVATGDVRSPVDYRVGLRNIRGRWMIDFFVRGD